MTGNKIQTKSIRGVHRVWEGKEVRVEAGVTDVFISCTAINSSPHS